METTTLFLEDDIVTQNVTTDLGPGIILPDVTGISKEFFEIYRSIMGRFIYPAICFFGLIGNSFGLAILRRDTCMHKHSQSTFKYMLALIAFDTVLLLTGLAQGVILALEVIDGVRKAGVDAYFRVGKVYTDFVLYHSTSLLLIIMAIERLSATVWPFSCKKTLLARHPVRIIIVIFAAFLILSLPTAFCFQVQKIYTNDTITYVVDLNPKLMRPFKHYARVEALMCAVYVAVLTLGNSAIAIAYFIVQRKRELKLPSTCVRRSHTTKITALVYWISFMYIFNSLPRIIHNTLLMTDKEYAHTGSKRYTLAFIQFNWDIFTRINAANDFLIYFILYERYRNIFCNYFSQLIHRNTNQHEKTNQNNRSLPNTCTFTI